MPASLADLLQLLVGYGPGRTEVELAEAVYGSGINQHSVMLTLQLLEARGAVTRNGDGSLAQPHRYFTRAKDHPHNAPKSPAQAFEQRR